MLTISKALSAGQAQAYHKREFTAKEQNYWTRGQDESVRLQGEWQGRLAGQFGLSGAVDAEEFARLSQGQHPVTQAQLVQHRVSFSYQDERGKTVIPVEHRAGWDATFSAPKSVSLTALVGGDDRVRVAHREAVTVALRELESFTLARIGGNHPPELTSKFIAAKFEHDTARPVDGYAAPQLHTHAVIFNLTERGNGDTRALQERSLFQSQQFATAVYQSELMYRLVRLGYEWETGRSGAPEIKGYTQDYLDASSPRSQQIREHLDKIGIHTPEAAQIAAHLTRDRKEILSPAEVVRAHRELAAAFGHQAQRVVEAAHVRTQMQSQAHRDPMTSECSASTLAQEALTFARDKNSEREAVIDERALMRDALRRGMGDASYREIRANLEARLGTGEFVLMGRSEATGALRVTTAQAVSAERAVIQRMITGQNQVNPILSREAVVRHVDGQPLLNCAQRQAIEEVLTSRDRIQGIQGIAGAGKTTALAAIRAAAEGHGYQVEGLAPTSRASKQLNEAGIEGRTLQGFLTRGPEVPARETSKRLFFIDESSLAGTNQMQNFFARMSREDRVVLVGDTRQHQGVESGRPFEQLQQAGMRTAQLDEIVRQKDQGLKRAVELLAAGSVQAAIASLREQGRVTEIPERINRFRALASHFAAQPEKTLIVSPDNDSRRALNEAVRRELKNTGQVSQDEFSMRVLIPRQDMTGAERRWATQYESGDMLRYARGSQLFGIEAQSYARVVEANPALNLLTVKPESGENLTYDPRRLSGVSVYREIATPFALGDRIQFTAPNRAINVANRDLGTIECIAPSGDISVRLFDGRSVAFNAHDNPHFDHGYAVTSHSSQGLTSERVLIHIDSTTHPDLLNTRFAYVSVSRASLDAQIFTDNAERLPRVLSHEVSKSAAIDFSLPRPPMTQAPERATEIGLGIAL
jgi:conjugative relaxase-like TrwC/TraI family protein